MIKNETDLEKSRISHDEPGLNFVNLSYDALEFGYFLNYLTVNGSKNTF